METSQGNSLRSYLEQTKPPFFKNGEQEGKTVLSGGLVPVGGGKYKERVQEGESGGNANVLMYENGKVSPAGTIPGMRG
jgi:hypothetical protein